RFGALEDSSGIVASSWRGLGEAVSVAHQAAVRHGLAVRVNRRNRIAGGQRDDVPSSAEQERIGALDQRTDAPFDERRECAVDFRFATGIDDMELAAEFLRRFLDLRGLESDFGVVWIEQQSDDASVGNELKQKLQLLGYNIATEPADAGNVSTRLVEAPDDTCLDWIAAEREHDRDRRSRRLGGNDRRSAADCNDYRDPSGDKISRQYWQSVILTVGPTEGDVNVLAFDLARVPQSQPKCHLVPSRFARRPAAEEPDHRHRRLLRARRERPRDCSAAEQRDELAAVHSITSSARAKRSPRSARGAYPSIFVCFS